MDKDKFEMMEKWHSMMGLFNIDIRKMYDDWGDEDETDLLYLIRIMNQLEEWKKDTSNHVMTAALRTFEMGITNDDVDEYNNELDELESQRIQQAIVLSINENPCIIELRDSHGFHWVNDVKQYPDHIHYKFVTSSGIEVRGRSFRSGWSLSKNWLYWKDSNGKQVSQHWVINGWGISIPQAFPEYWRETSHNTTSSLDIIPYIIAHHVVNRTMPKVAFGGNFKYPKK